MNKAKHSILKICSSAALIIGLFLFLLPAAVALADPIITVTKTDSLISDLNSDGNVNPGDRLRYTVHITNSGNVSGTNVVFSDTLDPNTTLVSGSLKTSPVAVDDSYSTIGNIAITISAANGLLVNDFGLPSPTVVNTSGASANGGSYTINSDGSFSYEPAAGFTGADTFSYSITNGNGTDTASVTVNVSGKIWFVNNNAGACSSNCDGRLSHPYTSLEAFRLVNNGVTNHPGISDTIFIYESSTDYAVSATLTLSAGQRLIGQDASSSLQALSGLTPALGSDPLPSVNSSNGTTAKIVSPIGIAINLGKNNRLYGLTIGQSGTALQGSWFETLIVRDVAINTLGQGVLLDVGTADAIFSSVTSGGGTGNVYLNVNGSVDLGTGALSGAANTAFQVRGSTANITYTGSINSSYRSVYINTKSGGSRSCTWMGILNS